MTSTNTILVTGAAGYIASWVVAQLLQAGHRVHGTVRSLSDRHKIQHLTVLETQYAGQLTLFAADLEVPHSFDAAMQGCTHVIHVASPYFFSKPKDPMRELVQPALEGTRNVLASVNRTESVKRVVLTSSVVALYNDACDVGAETNHTVQESDVNPITDPHTNPYAYSKTVAEKAAWDMQGQQQRWDLVTIHPGAVFGPSLSQRVDASSVTMVIQFLKGAFRSGVPALELGLVDVRDVAHAHVQAALRPQARHRYTVVAQSLRLLDMAKRMRLDGTGIADKLPRSEAPKWLMWLIGPLVGLQRSYVARNVGHTLRFNNQRGQTELGLRYRSPDETLNDQIQQLLRDGLLTGTP
ncbi:MAG: NAD-dependent epimerase/dehydratase family protein [Pseudomonadota bacterium]